MINRYEPQDWEELFFKLYYEIERTIENNFQSPDWKLYNIGVISGKVYQGAMYLRDLEEKAKQDSKVLLNEVNS
jgi:hypothetical protein